MENQRIFLWGALGLVLLLLYQAWVTDQAKLAQPAQPPSAAEAPLDAPSDLADLPAAEDLPELPAAAADTPAVEPAQAEAAPRGERILVITDVFRIEIDTLGGDLRQVDLPEYPQRKDRPDVPVTLLNDTPQRLFIFQTGVRIPDRDAEPNHRVAYRAERDEYRLGEGADELRVVLSWSDGAGLEARKIYTFQRGSYRIGLAYEIENKTDQALRGAGYAQIKRRHIAPERKIFSVDSYSYRGPVFYDGEKYEKIGFDELAEEPLDQSVAEGWIASIQHHFLAAAIPADTEPHSYQGSVQPGDIYLLRAIAPVQSIPVQGRAVFEQQLFVGPKLQSQLREVAKSLALTVDYGWMTIISQPLFWLLSKIHSVVGNWGWAIVLLTFLIKLVFYKLQEKSGRQMAKMRKLQPKMKALQERYKDDRQKLSQAMMELYKREKANPVAGCLPVLVQMPVFLALYWVLLESVELRQAPYMLWIQDLSVRDPFFVLPVLMGVTMFAQTKLNPPPPDPVQAKVMMIMPLAMSAFMAFFPAGLVLYWFTNTLLSVLQQWHINRVIEKGG